MGDIDISDMVHDTSIATKRWWNTFFISCWVTLINPRSYLNRMLRLPGPFSDPDWVPGDDTIAVLHSAKVLFVS
jgi:hypothetical protein